MSSNLSDRSALVIGGTAGIGEAIATRLASLGASVVIVGRNAEAGAAVVARMQAASPAAASASFDFMRLDASSLEATQTFTEAFTASHESKALDILVMCQSKASFGGREPTKEGFEMKLVLHAYSRILLARELLPLLQKCQGRVMSVLSGGVHAPYTNWQDADLKQSFSLKRAADAAGFYNDLGFQHLADAAADSSVGFLHAAPGFVASSWGHQTKAAFLLKLMQRMFAKSSDECAQIMVAALCDPRYAAGFHCVNEKGEPAKRTSAHTPENITALQAHLQRVYSEALGPDA